MQQNQYDKEPLTAVEAQRLAQEIAFGPIVFQVSRLMLKFGIFQLLADERAGMTQEEISKAWWPVFLCNTSFAGSLINDRYRIAARKPLPPCQSQDGSCSTTGWYVSIWISTTMSTIWECSISKRLSPTDVPEG